MIKKMKKLILLIAISIFAKNGLTAPDKSNNTNGKTLEEGMTEGINGTLNAIGNVIKMRTEVKWPPLSRQKIP